MLKPVIVYPLVDRLIEALEDGIVRPAEAKFNQLLARRTKQLRVENVQSMELFHASITPPGSRA